MTTEDCRFTGESGRVLEKEEFLARIPALQICEYGSPGKEFRKCRLYIVCIVPVPLTPVVSKNSIVLSVAVLNWSVQVRSSRRPQIFKLTCF